MLATHSLIRLAAFSLTIIFILSTLNSHIVFKSLVFIIALGHYYLGFIYSSGQIKTFIKQPYGLVGFIFVLLSGSLLYLIKFPLVWYFCIHHAFNEVYMIPKRATSDNDMWVKNHRASGVILHVAAYCFILREQYHMVRYFNPNHLLIFTVVAFVFFAISFYKVRQGFNAEEIINNCAGEVILLLLVFASFFFTFQFLHVVLYHFLSWWFFPLQNLINSTRIRLYRYLGATIFFFIIFYLVSPIGIDPYNYSNSIFENHFLFMSYLHITFSFFISSANPSWLKRRFQPQITLARI